MVFRVSGSGFRVRGLVFRGYGPGVFVPVRISRIPLEAHLNLSPMPSEISSPGLSCGFYPSNSSRRSLRSLRRLPGPYSLGVGADAGFLKTRCGNIKGLRTIGIIKVDIGVLIGVMGRVASQNNSMPLLFRGQILPDVV